MQTKTKYIKGVIDTETTGLSPVTHEMVSFTVILVDDKLNPTSEFTGYIRPQNIFDIDPNALKINGFTVNQLKTFPTKVETRIAFNEWLKENVGDNKIFPIGHNYIQFDKGFLLRFLGETAYDQIFHYHLQDTMLISEFLLSAGILNVSSCSLKSLVKELNLEYKVKHVAHTSASDARLTLELYKELLHLTRQGVI